MTQALWYLRSGGQSSGPFPTAQVAQYVELGRLGPTDLISLDGVTWVSVEASGQFEAALQDQARLREPGSPAEGDHADWERERALARRRWLDERNEEGRLPPGAMESRSGESLTLATLRQDHLHTVELARQARGRRPPYRYGALALLVVAGVAVAVWFGQSGQPEPRLIARPDCAAEPGPGVAWIGCDKRQARLANAQLKGAKLAGVRLDAALLHNAELSYVDLRGASLRGADLTGARLAGADLTEADLSGANLTEASLEYATLSGANLAGVRLSGTRMGKAVWIDGRLCAPGSRDGCG